MWYGSEDLSEINCTEVLHEMQLYIDGELDPERAADFAEHLERCSPCLEHSEFQRKLKAILRAKCRGASPEHVVRRVREAIRLEGRLPS